MPTTTTTTAPAAPPADLVALASKFDVAATTPTHFGLEGLFGRWQELRIASARHPVDMLQGVSFATVIDAVLDYRSNPARGFSILTVAKAIQL